jgi:TRAP-type C4-dicarboxylate transport system substrate-binding protein
MRRRRGFHIGLKVMILAFVMLFLASSLLLSTGQAAEKVYKGRFSYHWYPTHMSAKFSELWVKYCKEATNGRLDITTYPSGQLYKIKEAFMALSKGSVDIAGIANMATKGVDPIFYIGELFLFWSGEDGYQEEQYMFSKTEAGKKYYEEFQQKHGIKYICFMPLGNVTLWTKKPVETPEDYKGMKIRTQSQMESPFFEELGAHPVFISTGEVYTALQQGMVDGIITHPTAEKAYDWWAYATYVQQPGYAYNMARIGVNLKWWNSLPKDIQDIVLHKVSPRVEKEALDEIWRDHHSIVDEFVNKKGGKVTKMSPELRDRIVELAKEKIWPAVQEKLKAEPGMWEAALETREAYKKGLIK